MLSNFIILTIIFIELAVPSSDDNSTILWNFWNYEDESTWPGEKCQEGGRRQSPIDIKTSNAIKDFRNAFIKYGNLKFIGYNQVLLTGLNNGHTIQFSTEGDKRMHPLITGGPLEFPYRMEQMHFHWLSEHSIDGHKYPLEIHFVHIRADLSVQQALSEKDGLAIVSVFCNVIGELDEVQFERTETFMQYIPKLLKPGARISGILMDVTELLSRSLNSYYTYAGSLTSPECNEVVTWIIFDNPLLISDAQYRLFGKASKGHHNFRSLQPQRWQQVYRPPPSSIWSTPTMVTMFKDVIKAVASLFRNVTNIFYVYDMRQISKNLSFMNNAIKYRRI